MRPVEALLLIANLLTFFVLVVLPSREMHWTGYAALTALTIAFGQVLVEGSRWQMIPAYLLTALFFIVWLWQKIAPSKGAKGAKGTNGTINRIAIGLAQELRIDNRTKIWSGESSLCEVFQNKLLNDRDKELSGYLITVVDESVDAHRLQLTKGPQRTKEVVANRLFISNIKTLNVAHLLDNPVKTLNLPMVIMDSLEGASCQLLKGR